LYTSSFFLNAFPVSFAASISSAAKNLGNAAHFLDLAESISHFAARKSCLFGLTS
jgi:hypothetical protein